MRELEKITFNLNPRIKKVKKKRVKKLKLKGKIIKMFVSGEVIVSGPNPL